MAVIRCLVQAKFVETTQTTQYTVPGALRVVIDNITFTNISAATVVISANIVPSGGSAGASNRVMQSTSLAPGDRIEQVFEGQYLNPGDSLSTIADIADSVVIRVNGRELT